MFDPWRNRRSRRAFAVLLVFTVLVAGHAWAQDRKPKLGPDAVTIQQSHGCFLADA